MIHIINIAYATTSSSSIQVFNGVASSTGQLIEDNFPFITMWVGILLAIIFSTLIMRVMISAMRHLTRRKR